MQDADGAQGAGELDEVEEWVLHPTGERARGSKTVGREYSKLKCQRRAVPSGPNI